jgi:hypothetical protein
MLRKHRLNLAQRPQPQFDLMVDDREIRVAVH